MENNIKRNVIDIFGDVISITQDSANITLSQIKFLIENNIIIPIDRLSLLNQDETVSKIIPDKDIAFQGISYSENYQSGARRNLSIKLINNPSVSIKTDYKRGVEQDYLDEDLPYTPNINGIWYGTKFKYDIGFIYNGQEIFFSRGIYIVNDFNMEYGSSGSFVSYELGDKFYMYESNTRTLIDGYEIPSGVLACEAIKSIQNLNCTDGSVMDIKDVVIHNSYSDFKTQQTIAVSAGEKISDIYDQIGTQMSAEYYYNNEGILCFTPIDESLNEINKPIIWSYTFEDLDDFSLQGNSEIINVIKVIGTNINEETTHIGIAKNTNLNSSINIYYVKERCGSLIESSSVYSNQQAEELAAYHLRQSTIQQFTQRIQVPYNPLLSVNNIIEITIKKLKIERKRFLINSISYVSRNSAMVIGITNIDELPIIGGV